MTSETFKILAVIDPTRSDQWSLRKAIGIGQARKNTQVMAYLSVFSDAKCVDPGELRRAEVRRNQLWLDELLEGIGDTGIQIDTFVEWNEDWRDAVGPAAADSCADLVIKHASDRPSALANSDRHLIRTVNCPILLVKHEPKHPTLKILIAVDFNRADETHANLNQSIIEYGNHIRGVEQPAELHAVNAYSDSSKFIHPPDLAKKVDIDRAQAHVKAGDPGDVISEIANEVSADLVIVGNVGRRGLSGITIGNTSEKILTDVRSDVLILSEELKEEKSAA
jgi:universal stress protein E